MPLTFLLLLVVVSAAGAGVLVDAVGRFGEVFAACLSPCIKSG